MNGTGFTKSSQWRGESAGAVAAQTPTSSGFSGYGSWLLMGISSKQGRARRDSHLGQLSSREAAIAARDGGADLAGSVDDGGSLRCTTGLNERPGSYATWSLCSSRPSIAVSGGELVAHDSG
jgi:hypothetical protein